MKISLKSYTGGKPLDFKKTNGEGNGQIKWSEQDYYRGMPIGENGSKTIYGSARDVGNMAAGNVAAKAGLTWQEARMGFDGLQSIQQGRVAAEGASTQQAQKYGYDNARNSMSSLSFGARRASTFTRAAILMKIVTPF